MPGADPGDCGARGSGAVRRAKDPRAGKPYHFPGIRTRSCPASGAAGRDGSDAACRGRPGGGPAWRPPGMAPAGSAGDATSYGGAHRAAFAAPNPPGTRRTGARVQRPPLEQKARQRLSGAVQRDAPCQRPGRGIPDPHHSLIAGFSACHSPVRPRPNPDGRAPAEAAGVAVRGDGMWGPCRAAPVHPPPGGPGGNRIRPLNAPRRDPARAAPGAAFPAFGGRGARARMRLRGANACGPLQFMPAPPGGRTAPGRRPLDPPRPCPNIHDNRIVNWARIRPQSPPGTEK